MLRPPQPGSCRRSRWRTARLPQRRTGISGWHTSSTLQVRCARTGKLCVQQWSRTASNSSVLPKSCEATGTLSKPPSGTAAGPSRSRLRSCAATGASSWPRWSRMAVPLSMPPRNCVEIVLWQLLPCGATALRSNLWRRPYWRTATSSWLRHRGTRLRWSTFQPSCLPTPPFFSRQYVRMRCCWRTCQRDCVRTATSCCRSFRGMALPSNMPPASSAVTARSSWQQCGRTSVPWSTRTKQYCRTASQGRSMWKAQRWRKPEQTD
mmetsp:Transcript_58772/g.162518  ORF Transcript_58772/g.162518 Transcript_58772/m.162518 type:complete len:264 (+) Transcript_58772:103-894(+)